MTRADVRRNISLLEQALLKILLETAGESKTVSTSHIEFDCRLAAFKTSVLKAAGRPAKICKIMHHVEYFVKLWHVAIHTEGKFHTQTDQKSRKLLNFTTKLWINMQKY